MRRLTRADCQPAAPTVAADEPLPDSAAGLDAVLRPQSIAVIGASRRANTIGHELLRNLVRYDFGGAVYPINPSARAVAAMRAYPGIADVPDEVDLAVIAVPKEHVVEAAEQCGEAGVRGLVVISAGFREIGPSGAQRERELVGVVKRHGMRMVGPNCMGVLNTEPGISMNATFAPTMPPQGRAAFVSQSGALGLSVLDYAREYGIGISHFVSVGNKPDVSGNDLLLYWEDDPAVSVVLMYVENFGNPRRFLEIAARVSRHKPIIALKSGRSVVGARAASSHTGALAASDAAVEALLAQAGVLRAASIEELFDMAMAFGGSALPRSRRAAILTNSGGPGILAADAMEAAGLELVELSDATVEALRPHLPAEASIRNPLDMIASANPASYRRALSALLADDAVDSVMAIFVPPLGVRQEDVAEAIVAASATPRDKPVFAVLMGRDGLPAGRAELHAAGVPAYIFPESAARAMAALARYAEMLRRERPAPRSFAVDTAAADRIIAGARSAGRARLNELEALHLLTAWGIPVAGAALARTADDAAAAARRIGFPVAMKVVAPDIVHKSDVGGVILDVRDADGARAAFERISAAARSAAADVDGVLVQQQLHGGTETIVGMSRDAEFGPLIMFGLGGIFVEALRDVSFRIAPLDDSDARAMIDALRARSILQGLRGRPPADEAALVDVVLRVSQLALHHDGIAELDINPLLARPDGAVALDARVLLS
jgi:acetate---CoA ligase (ADP-forming)